jgi:hypothetical protein
MKNNEVEDNDSKIKQLNILIKDIEMKNINAIESYESKIIPLTEQSNNDKK